MQTVKKFIPLPIKKSLRTIINQTGFVTTGSIKCNTSNLHVLSDADLDDILSRQDMDTEYDSFLNSAAHFKIEQTPGGVNDGDRRAIYHLVRRLPAFKVLEIGTHIGASTISIAGALKKNAEEHAADVSIQSVDIIDVNGDGGAFIELNLPHSPRGMMDQIGASEFTQFFVSSALDFLAASREEYDLIFLDGDHSPAAVYKEIPLALQRLRPGGIVLLHDYFPDGRQIWPDGTGLILGPYKAVRRHMAKNRDLDVKPLGALPWPTKLGSHQTSLAILRRKGPINA